MLLTMLQTIEQANAETLERLLLRTAAGDREAFSALYQASRAAVYALTLSLVKNSHDAQDITQDAFVRVWESAPTYRPQGSPMAWLLTIARNLARMKLRQGQKVIDLDEERWEAIPAEEYGVSAEDRAILQQAMSALSAQERQVILLHAVTGLKHREIAALLELPLPTVLSKYHRALKKLKTQMEGEITP